MKTKSGKLRLVQDYRYLNKKTQDVVELLLLIAEIMDVLKSANYYSKFDVRLGFNNIRIKAGDEWKAAFRTNRGLFEPTVMFFRLKNSPATFQRMMNEIFRELIFTERIVVYMDDILVFAKTLQELRKTNEEVFRILRKHKLYLNREKCIFEATKIEFLGLVISPQTIEMDPVKVEGVTTWPTPTKKKEVQSFLGFVNFYRRFIKDFATIAKPLHALTGNDPWVWGPEQDCSFGALKKAITQQPVLRMPNDNGPFKIEADSSDYATGVVLSQQQE